MANIFKYANGDQFQQYIESFLTTQGHKYKRQVYCGFWLNTHQEHKVDLAVGFTLIELKYQNSPGTTESKLMEEIILMDEYLNLTSLYDNGLFVLGGNGWSPRRKEYYLTGKYKKHICSDIEVITDAEFRKRYTRE